MGAFCTQRQKTVFSQSTKMTCIPLCHIIAANCCFFFLKRLFFPLTQQPNLPLCTKKKPPFGSFPVVFYLFSSSAATHFSRSVKLTDLFVAVLLKAGHHLLKALGSGPSPYFLQKNRRHDICRRGEG